MSILEGKNIMENETSNVSLKSPRMLSLLTKNSALIGAIALIVECLVFNSSESYPVVIGSIAFVNWWPICKILISVAVIWLILRSFHNHHRNLFVRIITFSLKTLAILLALAFFISGAVGWKTSYMFQPSGSGTRVVVVRDLWNHSSGLGAIGETGLFGTMNQAQRDNYVYVKYPKSMRMQYWFMFYEYDNENLRDRIMFSWDGEIAHMKVPGHVIRGLQDDRQFDWQHDLEKDNLMDYKYIEYNPVDRGWRSIHEDYGYLESNEY